VRVSMRLESQRAIRTFTLRCIWGASDFTYSSVLREASQI
jgi:hypothetical protein